jgi:MtN3 and saliva related transmembrane protein
VTTELIGWASSVILLLTIGKQIHKQWITQSSAGVSKWLFIGQLGASLGFMIYSYLLHNRVFVATNALMALSAIVGVWIVIYQRSRRP